jgi:hypothetical protein
MSLSEKVKFFVLLSVVFVLSGCDNSWGDTGLKMLDENLGKALNSLNENQASSTFNVFNHSSSTDEVKTAANLTDSEKKVIDAWLEKKGLNRYGDAKNAVYTGGTPLFDESTGKSIERYAYILNKFPDILDLIKEGK